MPNIEKLTNDTHNIASELEAIKKLAESERKPKQTELKTHMEEINTELQTHLQTLQAKTDAQSANERAKTESLLTSIQTYNDQLLQLGGAVQANNQPSEPTGEQKNWIKEQREKATDKNERKEHPWQNAGRVAAGVGAAALVYKGAKRLRDSVTGWFGGSKKTESKKEEGGSRRKSTLKWLGIAGGATLAAVGGIKLRDKLKERFPDMFGPELSFEDSFTKVQADINSVSEKHLSVGAGMKYEKINEERVTLTSYGSTVEIDIKNKKVLPDMDVEFKTFHELIHAANLANFCKGAFKGRCKTNQPFSITDYGGGDLEVNLLEEGNEEFISGAGLPMGKIIGGIIPVALIAFVPGAAKVLGIKGGFATIAAGIMGGHFIGDTNSTLQQICPQIADGNGRDRFLAYLNRLDIWTQGNQDKSKITPSNIANEIKTVAEQIEATESNQEENKNHGVSRELDAIPDPSDPNKLTIKSRGTLGETVVHYDPNKKTLTIDGLKNIVFTDIKEGIRVANLTNKLRNLHAGKCDSDKPFSYKGNGKGIFHPGLYVDNERLDDRTMTEESIKSTLPTLFKNKDKYIDYLNVMKNEHNGSLWLP